ncbi:MAG: class I SAM-dependent methyltransferase [Planctomycetota bacterium]|jgi:SAM-dependent methyltransferase
MSSPSGQQQRTEQAAKFWNSRHLDPAGEAHDNFLNHPLIHAYTSMRAFDGTLIGHLDALISELRRRTEPGDLIVSVGCGLGEKERILAEALQDRRIRGLDIAADIVIKAREAAAACGLQNLELEVGDFNQLELERNSCKVVLGMGAIHHIEALEEFWESCRSGLQSGGCVIGQEYVGPNRFQWTDAQIECCNRALAETVPDEHKVDHRQVERVPVETITALDPSEAVRSQEILSTCEAAGFDTGATVGAGCALLQPVLMRQIHTYDPSNWRHNRILAELFETEDSLMREGILENDFAMFAATPPS